MEILEFHKGGGFLCTELIASLIDKKSNIVFEESGYPNFINPFGNSKSPPADMEFVKNFAPPDFQAKNFTPSIHLISTVLVIKTQKK